MGKETELPSTVEQKRTLVKKHRDIIQQFQDYQLDIDRMNDHSQTLSQMSANNQVTSSTQQLMTKYNLMTTAVKDTLRKYEQNVSEHETYLTKYAGATEWIIKAENKFDSVARNATISQEDLEQGQLLVNELLHNKSNGVVCLTEAVEAGESLYANLSVQGRDIVRNDIKTLKQNFDNLYNNVSAFPATPLTIHVASTRSGVPSFFPL